jgi:hypothetical protein
MKCHQNNSKLQEIWDRLVLLLITEPRAGWEREFQQIIRREIERLALLSNGEENDG